MLDELNRINLLYDIYAPLLTERQRQVLQLYFSDNYSLAEIADEYEISRQAVYDIIKRVLASLEKLEGKLGLYELFNEQQILLDQAEQMLVCDRPENIDIKRLEEIIKALRSSSEQ
jgi:uncharacterized protein